LKDDIWASKSRLIFYRSQPGHTLLRERKRVSGKIKEIYDMVPLTLLPSKREKIKRENRMESMKLSLLRERGRDVRHSLPRGRKKKERENQMERDIYSYILSVPF
jgi:hypothetical protein